MIRRNSIKNLKNFRKISGKRNGIEPLLPRRLRKISGRNSHYTNVTIKSGTVGIAHHITDLASES